MVSVAIVDCHIPVTPQCVTWSRHGQIALCTPKHIQLIVPGFNAHGALFFQYGAIPIISLPVSDNAVTHDNESFWRIRKRNAPLSFRQACWWNYNPPNSLDLLVARLNNGRVQVYQCQKHPITDGSSWLPILFPELDSLTTTCIAASEALGVLAMACEDGKIALTSLHGTTFTLIPNLHPLEMVSRLDISDDGRIVACTSLGRVFLYSISTDVWSCILDDGILLPGPITFPTNANTILFTKFNRLYQWNSSGKMQCIEITSLTSTISSLFTNTDGTVTVLSLDHHCFIIDFTNSNVVRLTRPPWSRVEEDIGNEDLDGELENVVDEKADDMKSVMFYHGVAGEDPSVVLIVETFISSEKSRIYFHKLSQSANLKSIDRDFFVDQFMTNSNQTWPLLDTPIIKDPECPVCKASLSPLQNNNMQLLHCPSGHIFDICQITGQPIPSIECILKCHRCNLKATAAKNQTSVCPRCQGTLLKVIRK